jgi:hypothetical protein
MVKQIFVFGSNEAGRHGAGAAKCAREQHGAIYGRGVGIQGNSYAIPTKDGNLNSLSLYKIAVYVEKFIEFASAHPEMQFNVTRIGCGLAGYKPIQIGPMFRKCYNMDNVNLDNDFTDTRLIFLIKQEMDKVWEKLDKDPESVELNTEYVRLMQLETDIRKARYEV